MEKSYNFSLPEKFVSNVKDLQKVIIFEGEYSVDKFEDNTLLDFSTCYIIDKDNVDFFIKKCEESGIFPVSLLYVGEEEIKEIPNDLYSYFDLCVTKSELNEFHNVWFKIVSQREIAEKVIIEPLFEYVQNMKIESSQQILQLSISFANILKPIESISELFKKLATTTVKNISEIFHGTFVRGTFEGKGLEFELVPVTRSSTFDGSKVVDLIQERRSFDVFVKDVDCVVNFLVKKEELEGEQKIFLTLYKENEPIVFDAELFSLENEFKQFSSIYYLKLSLEEIKNLKELRLIIKI